MTSIIKNSENYGIELNTSSKSFHEGNSNNVLNDTDSTYFWSINEQQDQGWEISFSKIVSINSYTIRTGKNDVRRPLDWIATASINRSYWEIVSIVAGKDAGGNTEKFSTYFTVNCKYFRITLKENSDKNSALRFTFFDCFGGLGKNVSRRILCVQNTVHKTKNLLYSSLLFALLISC